jgi:hypothetical protein
MAKNIYYKFECHDFIRNEQVQINHIPYIFTFYNPNFPLNMLLVKYFLVAQ